MENKNDIGKDDTIICVEWYTQCNLKCDFCYNFFKNTIDENKQSNFDIIPYFNKLPKNKIFLEAGGELLLAPYFVELMEYKNTVIENYKSLVFSNGEIPNTKFDNILKELNEKNISTSIIISPHIEQNLKYMEQNLVSCYNHNDIVNINLVVTNNPNTYLEFLIKLKTLPIKNVHVNISFDFKMFDVFNTTDILGQYKTIAFIKSFKEVFDYIRDNFTFLNYGRGIIIDKYEEILNVFDKLKKNELELVGYNPSVSFFLNGDEVEIHDENQVYTTLVSDLENVMPDIKVDNSDVSVSEVLTFHICNF